MTQRQDDALREAVARGAALLDAVRPGWEREVFPASLQMEETGACILSQLFDGFQQGLDVLQPEEQRRPTGTARLVFVCYYGFHWGTALWKEEILTRRLRARSA